MSTRAQILVQGGINREKVLLYHHSDGYPSGIIPELQAAWELAKRCGFKAQRGGYAAAIILHATWCDGYGPAAQPEQGLDLHGDIEYLYIVSMDPDSRGLESGKPWTVEVYATTAAFWSLKRPHLPPSKGLRLLARGSVTDLDAGKIEKAEEAS